MKYLDNNFDICKIDEPVKNSFKWDWLERIDSNGESINTWCKKIDAAGQCYCILCNSALKYGGEGFKALTNHAKTAYHMKYFKIRKESISINHYIDDSMKPNSSNEQYVDFTTRKIRQEVLVSSFLAENSLSFSLAPKIIELSQTLSKDQNALSALSMNRSTASYKLKYGIAKTIKDNIVNQLKNVPFSINVDESTSKAEESILAVLVQFYSDSQKEVLIYHLASIKLSASNAFSIYTEIVKIFEVYGIPWNNLVSMLMDSCNTMRGKKSGVETRIRQNKAPHLLDIDGDTLHIANNCAKKFTSYFKNHLENTFDDIYYDMKSSSKRENFFKICMALEVQKLKPLRRPDHRWLYTITVLQRVKELWDALKIFYYFYLSKHDKEIYLSDIEEVYQKREISSTQKKIIKDVYASLSSQTLTKDAKARKERIIQSLFVMKNKTLLYMGLYKSVLPEFDSYIKLFETKQPMFHNLHSGIYGLVSKFLSFFLKPEVISECSTYKDLLKLNVNDSDLCLPKKLFFVGVEASAILKKMSKDLVINIKI